MPALAETPPHLLIAGGLLAALVLAFLAAFLLPGLWHALRLMRLHSGLATLAPNPQPAEIARLFAGDKRLAALWADYQDSLHIQKPGRNGPAVRSTVRAETWFNSQFVVDSRLRTEFFKHLPGLFTGIGIIGTFTGLIEGLHRFQVSENTATVRTSLESLMHSVGQAFLVSAAAITAAMVVTFCEKLLLASLYRRTESVAQAIDALFDAGAGEDYLSRLVSVSEASVGQSQALKSALVQEIGGLLRELSVAQIEAARQDSQRLGQAIAASIEQSLKAPMQALAAGMPSAAGEPASDKASQQLEAVITAFGERLDGVFGGPLAGLNQLNQQTAQAMQDAVRSLQSVSASLADTGRDAGQAAAEHMSSAMREIEARQRHADEQARALLEQLRRNAASAQSESSQAMQTSLAQLGQQVGERIGEMLGRLDSQLAATQQQAAAGQQQRDELLAERTASAVSTMSGSVEQAVKHMGLASVQIARSVQTLSQTTGTSLDRMQAAAERISQGAESFATAGERVGAVLGQTAGIASQLREAATPLTESAAALRDGLQDYRDQRDSVGLLVSELRGTVELARREASLTADVLSRIEASTERLGQAQHQSDQYLSGVTRVLAEAHQAFAEATRKTLALANTEFHAKLATSVGLLSSTIVELESSLGNAMPRAAH